MIALYKLEEYNAELDKGLKKLNGYNNAFLLVSLLSFILSIGVLFYFITTSLSLIPEGVEKTFDTYMIAISRDEVALFGWIGIGLMFSSAIFAFTHKTLLKKQLEFYSKNIHLLIIGKHKKIFKRHSKEAISAFTNEKNKKKLIEILSNQKKHIDFFINNYDDFELLDEEE